RKYTWRDELISSTKEPATLNLTETTDYYTNASGNGYTRPKSKTYADGYWETFAYDAQQRVTQTVTPWKDTPFASAASGARAITTHSFVSHDPDDVVSDVDERPRTVTTSVVTTAGGSAIITGRIWHVYKTDSAGVYTEIEERAASATAAFGDAGNHRTTRVHYTTDSAQSGYDADAAGRLHYED